MDKILNLLHAERIEKENHQIRVREERQVLPVRLVFRRVLQVLTRHVTEDQVIHALVALLIRPLTEFKNQRIALVGVGSHRTWRGVHGTHLLKERPLINLGVALARGFIRRLDGAIVLVRQLLELLDHHCGVERLTGVTRTGHGHAMRHGVGPSLRQLAVGVRAHRHTILERFKGPRATCLAH